MKLKNLRKKIRRLEARLQDGPKKLAKLKRKLEAIATADAAKAGRKSAAGAGVARQTVRSSTPTQKTRPSLGAKPQVKSAGAKRRSAAKKVKRKLNLSPERRAQLAAAMNDRWAAKRAAAEATPQDTSTDRDFTLGQAPQAP
jgi:hypothetical protein